MTDYDDRVQILVLDADDWREWRPVRLRALADAPLVFGSKYEDWIEAPEKRWRDRLSIPGGVNVVAYRNDEAVGMASGIPDNTPGTIKLISVWIDPLSRGIGVLELMITEILSNQAVRPDCLVLDVLESNHRAIKSYERNGFERTDREADTNNPNGREIVMVKKLR